jgi:hypothetical protein
MFGVIVLLAMASSPARAGPVTTFTDIEAFLAAAGDVQEIDFETLPDGSPSFSGALITPEFNYTNQGVEFFPHSPILQIVGNPISGFGLSAGVDGSGGPRNWMIAELVTPATAIGVFFPGHTSVSILDESGALLALEEFGYGEMEPFAGFLSDVPIGSMIVDRGIELQTIHSFLFAPIPDPTTLVLLGTGGVFILGRRR